MNLSPLDARRLTLAVFLLGMVPFLALAFFTVPQADDYCFANFLHDNGLWGAIQFVRDNFTGRILATVLIVGPTLVSDGLGIDLFTVQTLWSLTAIAAIAGTVWFTIRTVLPTVGFGVRAWLSGALLFSILANARSIRDLIYWSSQTGNYLLPGLLIFGATAFLAMLALQGRNQSNRATAVLAILTALAAICHELTGGMMLIILAGSVALRFAGGMDLQLGRHGLLAGIALVGFAILYVAPGNDARLSAYPNSGQFLTSLLWGVLTFAEFIGRRLTYPGTLAWLGLVSVLAPVLWRGLPPLRVPALAAVAIIGATWVIGSLFVFAGGYFGQGSPIPARVQNMAYLLSLPCLTLMALIAGSRLRRALWAPIRWFSRTAKIELGPRRLCRVYLLLFLASPGLWHAVIALAEAPDLRDGMRTRLAMVAEASGGDVVVPALGISSDLLLIEDLRPEADFWVNRCAAQYFGVSSIASEPVPRP